MTVLTRSPERLRGALPDIAGHPDVTVLAGDVRSFAFPEGTFSCVIHAAAEASAALNREAPLAMRWYRAWKDGIGCEALRSLTLDQIREYEQTV